MTAALAGALVACGAETSGRVDVASDGQDSTDGSTEDLAEAEILDAAQDGDTPARPQCVLDEDCAYMNACCGQGWCGSGVCQLRWLQGCCSVEGPCATGVGLHTATCEETCAPGGCVERLRLGSEGCGETLWSWEPDGAEPEDGLVFTDAAPGDRVAWHMSERRGLGGGRALYAGDYDCPTYYTGALDGLCRPIPGSAAGPVSVAVETPGFALPAEVASVALLWLWLDAEPPADPADPTSTFDGIDVWMVAELGVMSLLWSSREDPIEARRWTPVLVDLSARAGSVVSLRVEFETLDGIDNDHEGAYLGSIHVFTPCEADRDCPPDEPCAVGSAAPVRNLGSGDALCVVAPPAPESACEPCDDAASCTLADSCDVATCQDGRCATDHVLTPECCTPADAWPDDGSFEDALREGWTLEGKDTGRWHRSAERAYGGEWSLRFGVPGGRYVAPEGESASGVAWGPEIEVPIDAPVLAFQLWLSTEWDPTPSYDNPAGIDLLEVLVERVGVPLPPATLWSSTSIGGTTGGTWQSIEVPLDGLAGRRVRIGWRFGTGDESHNDFAGAFVDLVAVFRRCPG